MTTNPPPNPPKFKIGQLVRKVGGANFWGQVTGAPYKTTDDRWHYNVMAIEPNFYGTTHILIESQLDSVFTTARDWYNIIAETKSLLRVKDDADIHQAEAAFILLERWLKLHNVIP